VFAVNHLDHATDKAIYSALDGFSLADGCLVKNPRLQHSLRQRLAVVLRLKVLNRLQPADLPPGVASLRQELAHRKMVLLHQQSEAGGEVIL
jgi:hypothetical protein